MIAGRLTMRAAVERNTATGSDAWGSPGAPSFAAVAEAPLACFAWAGSSMTTRDGAKSTETTELRAMFALGADVRAGDEIDGITDRRGGVIFAGRMRVEGEPVFKHSHLEVSLKRIG